MADHFLQFSIAIENLNEKEHAWCKEHLSMFGADCPQESDANYEEFTRLIGLYGLQDDDDTLRFFWDLEQDYIHIYAEVYGDPEHVATFAQLFLQKFRPNDAFAMSWATSCSKMRIGEFGGGAVFVTAKKIEYIDAMTWCDEKWKTHQKWKSFDEGRGS